MCSFSTSLIVTLCRPARPRRCRQSNRQLRAGRDDHRALHDVAQLANVAWPAVALKGGHARPGDRVDPLAERFRELVDEPPDEEGNILDPLAQRWDLDREDVEAVEQVLAKRVISDLLLEIPVRRGDDPHVHVDAFRTPEPFDLPLFQYA